MNLEFLRRVLPPNGQYILASSKGSSLDWKEDKATTLEELGHKLRALMQQKRNLYFATASFKPGKKDRSAGAVVAKKILYVDIDVQNHNATQYSSKREALLALKQFVADTGWPLPTFIVDSGNGLHLYWVLTEIMAPDKWRDLAEGMQQLFTKRAFFVDEKITVDTSRVLRVPGSFNYKNGEPIECVLLRSTDSEFAPDDLRAILAKEGADSAEEIDPSLNDDLTDNLPPKADTRFAANHMVGRCEVMKHALEIGGRDQPGVLWFKLVHNLAWCDDGHDYLHAISNQHAEYDHAATEAKFARAQKLVADTRAGTAKRGGVLCDTFAALEKDRCKSCQHYGRIRSPLSLARELLTVLPPGYIQTANGIFRDTQQEDRRWVMVVPYTLDGMHLSHDRDVGHTLCFNVTKETNTQFATIPTAILMGPAPSVTPLGLLLAKAGMMLNQENIPEFKRLLMNWAQMLQNSRATPNANRAFGWTEGNQGFTVAQHTVLADGRTEPVARTDTMVASFYMPAGDPAIWRQCAAKIAADPRPEMHTMLASAFAAPLIPFTGVDGVLLSLVSKGSATGKSTVLKAAQAVWGNPQIGIHSLEDTHLSVAKKLGLLRNLPVYWDELRMHDTLQAFIRLAFQLSQGKEKSRLTSGANMQEVGTWSTMLVAASNEPLADHIEEAVKNSDAGRARLFEMHASPLNIPHDEQAATRLLFGELKSNYGHAGVIYSEFLATNVDMVQDEVARTIKSFEKLVRAEPVERFWVSTCAALLVGAKYARHLGLVNLNIPGMAKHLATAFKRQRLAMKSLVGHNTTLEQLAMFLDAHNDYAIITDRMPKMGYSGRVGPVTLLRNASRFPIAWQYAQKRATVRINRKTFTAWLYQHYGTYSTTIDDLVKQYGAVEGRVSLGSGLAGSLVALRTSCIDIDLRSPRMATVLDLLEDVADVATATPGS